MHRVRYQPKWPDFKMVFGQDADGHHYSHLMPAEHAKPDVSWTDGLETKLRAALVELGAPVHGDGAALLKRLLEADKPDGWKWDG